MRQFPLLLAALGAGLSFAAPAAAQDAAGPDRVNQLIIYGDDPCPESKGDEIVVCARKGEGERYRIPENLRVSNSPENRAWTDRVLAYETVGLTGTRSCSPTGAGGWTGCSNQLIDRAYGEKKEDPGIRFSELIAAERAKRLLAIEADAADTQTRVEALEKEYEARQKAEAEAAAAAKEGTKEPPPLP